MSSALHTDLQLCVQLRQICQKSEKSFGKISCQLPLSDRKYKLLCLVIYYFIGVSLPYPPPLAPEIFPAASFFHSATV